MRDSILKLQTTYIFGKHAAGLLYRILEARLQVL